MNWYQPQASPSCAFGQGKLGVSFFPTTGRGLITRSCIEAGEVLLEVSSTSIISWLNPRYPALFEGIFEEEGILNDPLLAIILILLHELAQPCSHWLPYFAILPRQFNTPDYWSKEELDLLKGCEVYNTCLRRKRGLQRTYQSVILPTLKKYPVICGSSTPSFLQYQWCVNLVQSRACYIDGFDMFNGKRSCACYALVPVYDLANHYELPGTSRAAVFEYDRQRQAFRMTTNWSYQPMQEVWNCYGFGPDHDFLMRYGIVSEGNESHVLRVELSEEFLSGVCFLKEKQDYLRLVNLPSMGFDIDTEQPYLNDLFRAVRVYVFEGNPFQVECPVEDQSEADLKVAAVILKHLSSISKLFFASKPKFSVDRANLSQTQQLALRYRQKEELAIDFFQAKYRKLQPMS